MEINKVTYGTSTLVDLTSDTVTPETLASGITAHAANGEIITGILSTTTKWGDISGTLSNQIDLQTALNTKANIIDLGTMASVDDAPNNNKQYARQNGAWTEVTGGGGSGVPAGGLTGQVLAKASDDDGDAVWCWPGRYPSDKWYLPDGIQESQVLAAYQFVNRNSEAEALININNGEEYVLTKSGSVTWNAEKGFYIPPAQAKAGLNNATLVTLANNVLGAAFGFSDSSIETGSFRIGGIGLNTYRRLLLTDATSGPSYIKAPTINYSTSSTSLYCSSGLISSGVLACNFSVPNEMYIDGVYQSLSSKGNMDSNTPNNTVIGQANTTTTRSFYVQAVVFYTTRLSAAQHLQLANNINTLRQEALS